MTRYDVGVNRSPLALRVCELPLPLRAALAWAGANGFQAVELPIAVGRGPLDSASARRHFMQVAQSGGLSVAAVDGSLAGPTSAERFDEWADSLRRAAELAGELAAGCFAMRMLPGKTGPGVAAALEQADRCGVGAALLAADGGQEAELLLMAERGRVGLCAETAALLMSGRDAVETLAAWGGGLTLVRLGDARRGGAGAARFGQGDLDPPRLRAALEAIGYRGALVLTSTDRSRAAAELSAARATWEQA